MALTLHGTVSDNTVALDRKTATPLIINGDMAIAQRGTSVTGITGTGYSTLDRFSLGLSNLGTWTQSQSTDVPNGQGFSNSLKLDCTTANASPTGTNNMAIMQRFEGQNLQMLNKGTSDSEVVTISFWVKSNKTGTYILELRDADNVRIICKAYTIDSANTWEKKLLSFAGDTTGTLDNDNNLSLHARWWLGAGSDFTSGTLATSWEASTNANRAVGQVNLADSTSNDWYITGIQMEIGTFDANSIPPFQFEDRATSLARCQRYCYQEDNSDTYHNQVNGFFSSSTLFIGLLALPVALRSTPTLVTSGDYQTTGTGSLDASSLTIVDSTGTDLNKIQVRATVSGATAGQGTVLRNKNDANAIFRLDSEL